MIQKALEYLRNSAMPESIKEILAGKERFFTKDGESYREVKIDYRQEVAAKHETTTLSSIVEYVASNVDPETTRTDRLIVHIVDEKTVQLKTEVFGQEMQRTTLIEAHSQNIQFNFGSFMEQEQFVIGLMTKFEKTDDLDTIQKYASTMVKKDEVSVSDDNVSQEITVEQGIKSIKVKVVNPVTLMPHRSFAEVEQPKSPFVFRVNLETGTLGLFEADAEAWKLELMDTIADYFRGELEEYINDNKIVVLV